MDDDRLYALAEEGKLPTGFGRTWVLGYDDGGEMRVRSWRESRRRGEPWWVKRYNPRNPWHRLLCWWTLRKGGVAWIEPS